jgi:malonyl CoA-acyl carrier protein transacylase
MQKKADCVVLRASCDKRLEEMTSDIRLIKSALVGIDMRGGLVNQVNALNERLNDIISAQRLKQSANIAKANVNARYKVAIIGLIGSLAVLALAFLLSKL